ncbi:hypothetical protein EON82_15900 [bacterium]|nr:MAG: hypothetical protein EON82_15900 [bacterium]
MSRKPPKSELERYIDSAVVSLRVQAIKRPEEWLRAIPLGVAVGLIVGGEVALGLLLSAIAFAFQMWFSYRQAGGANSVQGLSRLMREMAVKNARRDLRRGTYDAQVGPKARARLESCAASANVVIESAGAAYMMDGGGRPALEAFKPLTNGAEQSMKEALSRMQQAFIVRRMPDEEALADLREIDNRLAILRDEAKRLAREFKSASALSDPLTDPAALAEARRELDQGA